MRPLISMKIEPAEAQYPQCWISALSSGLSLTFPEWWAPIPSRSRRPHSPSPKSSGVSGPSWGWSAPTSTNWRPTWSVIGSKRWWDMEWVGLGQRRPAVDYWSSTRRQRHSPVSWTISHWTCEVRRESVCWPRSRGRNWRRNWCRRVWTRGETQTGQWSHHTWLPDIFSDSPRCWTPTWAVVLWCKGGCWPGEWRCFSGRYADHGRWCWGCLEISGRPHGMTGKDCKPVRCSVWRERCIWIPSQTSTKEQHKVFYESSYQNPAVLFSWDNQSFESNHFHQ